jgi:hypothetical protein
MKQPKAGKAQYSEFEAAEVVGVSVEELRLLMRQITGPETDAPPEMRAGVFTALMTGLFPVL